VKPADSNTYNVVITNSAGTVQSGNAILTVLTDTDGDGLPDVWEQGRPGFSAVDPSDAARDDDQDGLSNLAEYLAGTDYLDAASYLRVDLTVSGEAFVTFQAFVESDLHRAVQRHGLSILLVETRGRSGSDEHRVEVLRDTAASPQRFYRLATPSSAEQWKSRRDGRGGLRQILTDFRRRPCLVMTVMPVITVIAVMAVIAVTVVGGPEKAAEREADAKSRLHINGRWWRDAHGRLIHHHGRGLHDHRCGDVGGLGHDDLRGLHDRHGLHNGRGSHPHGGVHAGPPPWRCLPNR
jgi:hypothetical protein